MDKIFIKGLKLDAIIGIYPHERVTKQPLIFDIEVATDIKQPALSGLIADAVDYDLIINKVKEIALQNQFLLLETLIEELAQAILQDFDIAEVKCTVYKPQAVAGAETVGITIRRTKCKSLTPCSE